MGKKTLAEIQKGFHHGKAQEFQPTPEHIRINGHWIENSAYLSDPKTYNRMPFTKEYLEECGIDPATVSEDMLPEELKKAS